MTEDRKPKARIRDLEARMAAVEARLAGGDPVETSGRFWALEGVKAAEPEPAVVYAGVVALPGGAGAEWQMSHPSEDLLDAEWARAVPALSALAHPARIAMLRLVLREEAGTAADLAAREDTGTSGQVYHHLRQLVAAGWLKAGARGVHAVPADRLVPLLVILAAAGV